MITLPINRLPKREKWPPGTCVPRFTYSVYPIQFHSINFNTSTNEHTDAPSKYNSIRITVL